MEKDAEVRRDFVNRFVRLRNRMCQISETCSLSEQAYTDAFVESLSELGMGCVLESFPPSRMPSCRRGQDRYVAACYMVIADMRSRLLMRFTGRAICGVRSKAADLSLREAFRAAGMVRTGEHEGFRCLDIGDSQYSSSARMLSQDVPYVCI